MAFTNICSSDGSKAGIYVHIPFCIQKCPYCDFYSITDPLLYETYIKALEKEIQMRGNPSFAVDTIYLGGGTPSVLEPRQISLIFDTVRKCFKVLKGSEKTIEINPGTIHLDKLKSYQTAGLNRINIGVQSFNDDHLKFLGRIHTAKEAEQAFHWGRRAGFQDMGLDLIYGIPGQTQQVWAKDLERAIEFGPEHISCYMLTYEEGTPMGKNMREKQFLPLDDGIMGELYLFTIDFLDSRGYFQYEISNFTRNADFKSSHNCKYWSFAPYLGMGPSAHSFFEPERSWNDASIMNYIRTLEAGEAPPGEKEILNHEQLMMEAVYLGLRQTQGIHVQNFQNKFKTDFNKTYQKTLDKYIARGFIHLNRDYCSLTPEGMLYLDTIATEFIAQ